MLGWTQIKGWPYFVRQMKNMKASIPSNGSPAMPLISTCGLVVQFTGSRSHYRYRLIAGYCGKALVLDEALIEWTERYGDQTELDHAALVEAVKNDRQVRAMMAK
jgi:Uncharacterized protein conserved in bacteria (DUF2252)